MTDTTHFITRLTTAERGSPELSAEVLTVLTGAEHMPASVYVIRRFDPPRTGVNALGMTVTTYCEDVPSITESLDAAWEMAAAAGYSIDLLQTEHGCACGLFAPEVGKAAKAHTPALALCAAMVAARQQELANG